MSRPPMRRLSILVRFLLLAMLPATGLSAAPQQTSPQQPAPQEPALEQRPVFGATVSRVRVDVVVTDADGNFIDDLEPEDFTLLDDGVEQSVLSMQLVDLRAGVVTDLIAGEQPVTPPETEEPATKPAAQPAVPTQPDFFGPPAPAKPADTVDEADTVPPSGPDDNAASDLGAIIFLVDGPSISPGARRLFTDAWANVLEQTSDLHAPRAVYLIENTGRVEEIVPLTFDLEPLRRAGEIVRDAPTYGTSINNRIIELTRDMEQEFVDPGLDRKVRRYEFDERVRSINTLDTITSFCNALMSRNGRTALVWVSTGVKLTYGGPYAALLAGFDAAERDEAFFMVERSLGEEVDETVEVTDPEGDDAFADTEFVWYASDPDLLARQERLHEAANSANVSIYSIDPTPVSEVRAIGFDAAIGKSNTSNVLSDMDVQGSLDGLRDSMREVSLATGGEAMINPGNLSLALQRIEEDSSRFYLLTYSTPAPLGDGEYHAIEVQVQRPDVNVRERTGYVDLAPIERRTKAIAAALMLPGTVTAAPLGVKAFHMWTDEGQPVVDLAITVETQADLWRGPEGRAVRPWKELHIMALDGGGDLVEEFHLEVQPPGGSPAEGEPVTAGTPVLSRPYVFVYNWALSPGSYDVRLVVKDEISGDLGATKIEIEVPEPQDVWGTSDLMLTVTDGITPPQPLVDNNVVYGERLEIYAEVFGGEEPFISGSICAAGGNEALADLAELALPVDAVGIHRGALWLEGIPPGSYTLRIRVTDPPVGGEREFEIPLTALAPSQFP